MKREIRDFFLAWVDEEVATLLNRQTEIMQAQQEQIAERREQLADAYAYFIEEKRAYLAFLRAIRHWQDEGIDFEEALASVIQAMGDEIARNEEWLVNAE